MFVLCNPKAGQNTEPIAKLLEKIFSDIFIIRTENQNQFKEKLKEFSNQKRRIVVMGGDGTVNLACQYLANTDLSLGIIPTGEDNDFASGLGIPKDPIKAIKIARAGKTKAIDLGKVNDRYFCNSFGIGFDAQALKLAKEYKMETLRKLINCNNFPVKLDFHSGDCEEMLFEDALMITFANGKTECGGLRVNKYSSFNDHKLGLTVVRRMSKTGRFFSFLFIFSNFFDLFKSIDYKKIDFAELEILNQVKMHVDGEDFSAKKVNVQICPDALNVITA